MSLTAFDMPIRLPRNPLDGERSRGHRHVGGPTGRGPRERHWVGAALAIAAIVAAGSSAYLNSETAAQQARDQRRMAEFQAEQEALIAKAKHDQVLYEAKRKQDSFGARAASAGVRVGEGASLLENEMRFASDAEYNAQLAAYGNELQAQKNQYAAKLFSNQAKSIESGMPLRVGIAAASSLASNYGALTKGMNSGGYDGYITPGGAPDPSQ